MDIFILFALIGLINFFIKKKKREEAERKKRAALQRQQANATQANAPLYSAQQPPPYAVPERRTPVYQSAEGPRKPAPDFRFPDIDDLLKKVTSAFEDKPFVSPDAAQKEERERQERLEAIRRKKLEIERKREIDAPVLRSHIPENMEGHVPSSMNAPPAISLETDKGNRLDETTATRKTTERAAPSRPAQAAQPLYAAIASLSRDRNMLVQSIVVSEILGKPKALRG